MIRINLLATERDRGRKKAPAAVGILGQPTTLAAIVIILLTSGLLVWRWRALSTESDRLDAEITAAQQETQRLHNIIMQVQQFEQRKAQLQQRVVLIEELRKSQTGPVHLLDELSRALPPMLWLTEVKQKENDITIDGRSTTLTAVSEYVNNLEATGYFKKSIEIVDSKTEVLPQPPGEIVRFTIKAVFLPNGAATKPAAPAAGAAPAKSGG